jgi:hypothetical protein
MSDLLATSVATVLLDFVSDEFTLWLNALLSVDEELFMFALLEDSPQDEFVASDEFSACCDALEDAELVPKLSVKD